MSLKKKATKGILWVAVERFGQQLLQGVVFIILARLLNPTDFGLMGMLMIFFAIAQTFVDSGMGEALIREKEITDEDRSTVFWFNLFISITFYGLLYISAPWIADFYNQPQLVSLTRVMGLNVLFFAIAVVQRAEMTQQLQFKKQALAQVPAMALSGGISIWMAYAGYGVWALVAQYLLSTLLGSVLLWILSPLKIGFAWSRDSFNRLFGFGYKLLLSGLLNTTFDHIYKLVIGKMYSSATLGLYTQAQKLQQLASNNLANIIQKVSYPVLVQSGGDNAVLKSGYRKIIKLSSSVIFPCMITLAVLADPIVRVVLGTQWTGAIPFLQLLCIAGMFFHLNSINLNILKLKGRSDLFLKLEIIKKVIISISVLVGLRYGIWALLIGRVCNAGITFFINTIYTQRFINYSVKEQVMDVLNALLLSMPLLLVGFAVYYLFDIDKLMALLGVLLFLALVYLFSMIFIKNSSAKLGMSFIQPLARKVSKRFK